MGFLSNNVTPGHKQTAAFFKVSNKEVQISPSLIRIIFYFLLQYNILQSLSLSSQHCSSSNLNTKLENSVNISRNKV